MELTKEEKKDLDIIIVLCEYIKADYEYIFKCCVSALEYSDYTEPQIEELVTNYLDEVRSK